MEVNVKHASPVVGQILARGPLFEQTWFSTTSNGFNTVAQMLDSIYNMI